MSNVIDARSLRLPEERARSRGDRGSADKDIDRNFRKLYDSHRRTGVAAIAVRTAWRAIQTGEALDFAQRKEAGASPLRPPSDIRLGCFDLSAGDQKAPQLGVPFRFAHVSPVLQVRLAAGPTPQHSCPIAPHAAQSRAAAGIAAGAQFRFAPWQVKPTPVAAGQQA
jgi:hypothetical protein